jgi:alpha-L-rhamnosidase
MAERIAGIRPTTPGYGTFTVDPRPAGLTQFALRFPSVRGDIAVSWHETAGAGTLLVEVPKNSRATVMFPQTRSWGHIAAPEGSADPTDGRRFIVVPGSWTFTA